MLSKRNKDFFVNLTIVDYAHVVLRAGADLGFSRGGGGGGWGGFSKNFPKF